MEPPESIVGQRVHYDGQSYYVRCWYPPVPQAYNGGYGLARSIDGKPTLTLSVDSYGARLSNLLRIVGGG